MKFSFGRTSFPDDFIFGAATAAFQIEGGQGPETGRGSSHWDTFAATRGNVKGLHGGQMACDHYNRWAEDLDLLKDAGMDAYRFSFAWPRLIPEGTGAVNQTGIDFYDRLIDGMLERGLKPFATAYHWDLPSMLADRGGWSNRDIASWFGDYVALLGERFGDRLASFATLNEPWCIAWLSHAMGIHAPGHRDLRSAARAMHHTMLAHGKGMEAIRATAPKVDAGIVLNFEWANPADDSEASKEAAAIWHALYNEWYVSAVAQGQYPTLVTEALAEYLPAGWEGDMAAIKQPMDFLGINYYTRANMRRSDAPGWPQVEAVKGPLDKTQMGWEIYPEGLAKFLRWIAAEKTGDLPLYVTENGMAWGDEVVDGAVTDDVRLAYFDAHLSACQDVIADGVPLKGYFAWSLLDNYEWAEGYEPRFGIVHVDYETQKRTPKASYKAFQGMLTGNQ